MVLQVEMFSISISLNIFIFPKHLVFFVEALSILIFGFL